MARNLRNNIESRKRKKNIVHHFINKKNFIFLLNHPLIATVFEMLYISLSRSLVLFCLFLSIIQNFVTAHLLHIVLVFFSLHCLSGLKIIIGKLYALSLVPECIRQDINGYFYTLSMDTIKWNEKETNIENEGINEWKNRYKMEHLLMEYKTINLNCPNCS